MDLVHSGEPALMGADKDGSDAPQTMDSLIDQWAALHGIPDKARDELKLWLAMLMEK